jgi:hypothetical protein
VIQVQLNLNDTIAVSSHRPPRGTLVDSITYYTMELAEHGRNLKERQRSAAEIAESGNLGEGGNGWIEKVMEGAESIANQIMKDSLIENSLLSPSDSYFATENHNAEHMSSQYGSNNGRLAETHLILLAETDPADIDDFKKVRSCERPATMVGRVLWSNTCLL